MMTQIGLFSNCCNACDFCLRKERIPYSKKEILHKIELVRKNLDYVDYKNQFQHGISLLGGELYYIEDKDYHEAFLGLIDDIIEKVLKVSPNPDVKFSTVSNGMYDPNILLFPTMDKIVKACGTKVIDFNVSYDLKYRFHTEESRLKCLNTINSFHKRYDYRVGVQMILTQFIIDEYMNGNFSIKKFEDELVPGNLLTFLYPHKIATGIKLTDFNFSRESFLPFIQRFKEEYPIHFQNFYSSCINSSKFKWTGMKEKNEDYTQQPVLTDYKEIINKDCGHSILYKCYSDCDDCMLCDLEMFD